MRDRIAVPELAKSALALAVAASNGPVKLGGEIGVTPQAISQWRYVPSQRVLDVERVSGVPRHILRPDLYPPPAASLSQVVSAHQ